MVALEVMWVLNVNRLTEIPEFPWMLAQVLQEWHTQIHAVGWIVIPSLKKMIKS